MGELVQFPNFLEITNYISFSPKITKLSQSDGMQAVKNALGSVFFNKGENCIAAGRLFVEETIYDEFIEKYVFVDDDYDDRYVDPGSFCSSLKRPSKEFIDKYVFGGDLVVIWW